MSHPNKTYVVVLNWNHAEDTIACVKSLQALEDADFEVIVCDNDSRSDDVARLRGWCQVQPGFVERTAHDPVVSLPARAGRRLTLLHNGGNLGYAGGMNRGMALAMAQHDATHAWVLNNDTEVHPRALAEMLARLSRDARIGICGSTLVYHGRRHMVQALGGAAYQALRARSAALGAFSDVATVPEDPTATEARMAYVVGASMLVTRNFITQVGLMDESYFLYSEEHDWAYRGQQRGFTLGWAPRSVVYHKHGATIGTSASGGSALSLFYLYRNKAAFTRRHHPTLLVPALASLGWEAVKFLLKGEPAKARAVWRGLLASSSMARFESCGYGT